MQLEDHHPDRPSEEKPLILVVEDSRTQAAMLRHLLQQNGYDALIAVNGHEAVELACEREPALIISDIVMPVMDGYDMCLALKSHESLREVPVMLLTSLGDVTDIVRGLQAGADYYLTKPYDSNFLLSTVSMIFAQPLLQEGRSREDLEVEVSGQRYMIGAGRRQMLNLLLSTYSNAVIQNRILLQAQHELRSLNGQLVAQRQQIEVQQRELREANAQLRTQATRDSLTNLRNVRALKERLSEELERSRRQHEPLSLLLLDVDHFKQYNDSFGHLEGDEVLRKVAVLLEEQARASDFVARYGGEEFVILLPNTPLEASRVAAERVRTAINGAAWSKRAVAVSIGIATAIDIDSQAILAQADLALYASKSAGRNCATHASDLESK